MLGRPPGPIRVPVYFPDEITNMIHMIPLVMVDNKLRDIQKKLVEFISVAFDPHSSDSMALLHQFALFLRQAPLSFSQDVGKLFMLIVMVSPRLMAGETVSLHELAQQIHPPWKNGFLSYLSTVPNATLEEIFGLPLTADYLLHLVSYMEARAQGSYIGLYFDYCESELHKPQPSPAVVEKLIQSLPGVPLSDLAEDDRSCGVCRGHYGERGNFLNDEPEEPVKLPCGHHFGKSCITVVLSPEPAGWAHTCCPLCRQPIALLPVTPLGKILRLT